MPGRVRELVDGLRKVPAYVYDLPGLAEHAAQIRSDFPHELFYAAKANPDPEILRTLDPHIDGVEVASGGELRHVRDVLPDARLAFGGPGKTDEELRLALELGVERIHVESPHELARLGRPAEILLRVNLPFTVEGAALAMSGPFGMDAETLSTLRISPDVRFRGIHAHLASGLDADQMLALSRQIIDWSLRFRPDAEEINLGGGMAVDYASPESRFDWKMYGAGLPTRPLLRIEPGRAMTAYHGWYVTDVLDVKQNRGRTYAILRGGTHHLRTPVTKGHDQPFTVLPQGAPGMGGRVTLVGQLCTPKDVFATEIEVDRIAVGDLVAFGMAGAYAWNISHHEFLMHPRPDFHYLR